MRERDTDTPRKMVHVHVHFDFVAINSRKRLFNTETSSIHRDNEVHIMIYTKYLGTSGSHIGGVRTTIFINSLTKHQDVLTRNKWVPVCVYE